MMTREMVTSAVAGAWCSFPNKVMDPDLANTIIDNIMMLQLNAIADSLTDMYGVEIAKLREILRGRSETIGRENSEAPQQGEGSVCGS